jgi:hypothetical protein
MNEQTPHRARLGLSSLRRSLWVQAKRDAYRVLRSVATTEGRAYLRNVLAPQHGGVFGAYHRFRARAFWDAGRRTEHSAALAVATRHMAEDDMLRLEAGRHHLLAGNAALAEDVIRALLAARRKKLPPTLAGGIGALRDAADYPLSPAALDWAWSNLMTGSPDRAQWERRVRFGSAANRLLWDWMHCAQDRLGELDALIDPLEAALSARLRRQNRGLLLIASHLGAPTAAMSYFCRGGFPVKLMGRDIRSPSLCPVDYVDSENRYFLRHVRRALDQGTSLIVPAETDAGRNLLGVPFPGNATLRVMGWIPKLLWRERIGSLFLFPLWRNGRVDMALTDDAPQPDDDETYPDWERRWLYGYRDKLLAIMRMGPENLDPTSGFWAQF